MKTVADLEYSSSLNGASFLMYELKQVVKLKRIGVDLPEIRRRVVEENIFQFENKGSINRALPSVFRRAEALDTFLIDLMSEGSIETNKVINLYAIMKTDLLFFEFMSEVISEKFRNNDYYIEKKDLNEFFTSKAERSDKIAGWTAITVDKLKRAFMQVIYESGLLKERRGTELNRLIIDPQIKEHLVHIGDENYVRAMGD